MVDAVARRSAFGRMLAGLPQSGPILLDEPAPASLANILARKGREADVAAIVREHCGIDPPAGPSRIAAPGLALIGIGPGSWLATGEMARLIEALDGVASVADQSGGYARLRIAGPQARSLLSRGAFIDLHPDSFGPGAAAVTVIAHIGVILSCLDPDRFEVALFRSFADSFWHWMTAAAAGLGVDIAHAG